MAGLMIIDTGGTMSKTYPRSNLGYAFEMGDEPAASRILRHVPLAAGPAVVRVCAKDSTELTREDRQAVADTMRRATETTKRFVICHGTDTMVKTGLFLQSLCEEQRCVAVLVGSRTPEAFKDSDADFNLGFAVAAARLLPEGSAYIAMGGECYRCDSVERDDSNDLWRPKTQASKSQ